MGVPGVFQWVCGGSVGVWGCGLVNKGVICVVS